MRHQASRLITATLLLILFGMNTARAEPERLDLLIYCGITMIRPMTEIARLFEQREAVKITLAQGGSEDLYQTLKKSRLGDLYLPGEPTYRSKNLHEGLLGDVVTVGYNQLALIVRKGNPKNIKSDPRELLRKDLMMIIGNAESGSIGQETKYVLDAIGLYDKVLNASAFLAPDSRALNAAMKKGEADVALNWRATAFFPDNATVVDVVDLSPKLAKPQALLLNLLTFSNHQDAARRFMSFAASETGQAIFRKWGFLDNKAQSR